MTTLLPPAKDAPAASLSPLADPNVTSTADMTEHRPVAGWQTDRKAAQGDRTETASGAPDAAVDIMALLGRCLGNFELIMRVLARFRKTGGTDLDQLGRVIDQSDFAAVVAIAHRFKGAAGNISAAGLHKIAAGLEQLGRDQNSAELPGQLAQLRAEWEEFLRFADAFAPPDGTSQVQPVN
jgi:HPt (histidine-containing phosphotransfer) domain-containing protein